jgi:hypothetical protein
MIVIPRSLLALAACTLALGVAGCAQTRQRIADCKTGDWRVIGAKDGNAGTPVRFLESKEFCDEYQAGQVAGAPLADYTAGWAQGNWDFWSARAQADGRAGLAAQVDARAASAEVAKQHTPVNRQAYDAGWLIGNAAFWDGVGKRDGVAGQPRSEQRAAASQAAQVAGRFDAAAYAAGWQTGNRTFWSDAGFQDAHNGVADSALHARAANARAAGVQVQEDAYRTAWNAELPNYWRELGHQDAVRGKDLAMRRAEARQSGLKVLEPAYRQAWEARLADYWQQAGHDDGMGRPFQLDARMANATRDGVFVIAATRERYARAWEAENAKYCAPDNAFEFGRRNGRYAIDVCVPQAQGQLKRAYLSGQDYESAAARRAQDNAEIDDLARRLKDGRARQGRLEREMRASVDAKDRVANDETARQDKRREQDLRELVEANNRVERQLGEARRREDSHRREMERLRRDMFL